MPLNGDSYKDFKPYMSDSDEPEMIEEEETKIPDPEPHVGTYGEMD